MNRFGTVNGVAAAKNETVTTRKEMANLWTRCVAWFQNCMAAFVAFVSCMIWRLNAFALNIDTNYTVKSGVANCKPRGSGAWRIFLDLQTDRYRYVYLGPVWLHHRQKRRRFRGHERSNEHPDRWLGTGLYAIHSEGSRHHLMYTDNLHTTVFGGRCHLTAAVFILKGEMGLKSSGVAFS